MDLIKWIDDAVARARHGRGRMITWIPYTHSGSDVERMLRSYGIKVYARQHIDKQMEKHLKDRMVEPGRHNGVTVRTEQAEWAEYLMLRYGVAVTSPLVKDSHARVQSGQMPKAWQVPAKPVGVTGALVAALMGEIRYVAKEINVRDILK